MQSSIGQVLQRIKAIETKFCHNSGSNNKLFQGYLNTEIKAQQSQPTKSLALNDNSVRVNTAPAKITDMIAKAAQKYGVDPKLVDAVAKTESNYVPDAVSVSGAVGIMQLMPDTAAGLGVKDIYSPSENIEGGVKYIKQLLNTFDGNVPKAVAAYNAGPQAVKNYNGIPPYDETQNYVRKVLDIYR